MVQLSPKIKLEVATQGGYHRFDVTFATEAQAVDYINKHMGDRNVYELQEEPIDLALYPTLNDLLYPTCHHGMDGRSCMDPIGDGHFGTREQEMQNGW